MSEEREIARPEDYEVRVAKGSVGCYRITPARKESQRRRLLGIEYNAEVDIPLSIENESADVWFWAILHKESGSFSTESTANRPLSDSTYYTYAETEQRRRREAKSLPEGLYVERYSRSGFGRRLVLLSKAHALTADEACKRGRERLDKMILKHNDPLAAMGYRKVCEYA